MDDSPHGHQGHTTRLPAGRSDYQPYGAAVEVRSAVLAQVLEQINCILDEAGNTPVITGRGDDDAIRRPNSFDKGELFGCALPVLGREVRQGRKSRSPEKLHASAQALRLREHCRYEYLAGRARTRSPTKSDDQGCLHAD